MSDELGKLRFTIESNSCPSCSVKHPRSHNGGRLDVFRYPTDNTLILMARSFDSHAGVLLSYDDAIHLGAELCSQARHCRTGGFMHMDPAELRVSWPTYDERGTVGGTGLVELRRGPVDTVVTVIVEDHTSGRRAEILLDGERGLRAGGALAGEGRRAGMSEE